MSGAAVLGEGVGGGGRDCLFWFVLFLKFKF